MESKNPTKIFFFEHSWPYLLVLRVLGTFTGMKTKDGNVKSLSCCQCVSIILAWTIFCNLLGYLVIFILNMTSGKDLTFLDCLILMLSLVSKTFTDKFTLMASLAIYILLHYWLLWKNYHLVKQLPGFIKHFEPILEQIQDSVTRKKIQKKAIFSLYL